MALPRDLCCSVFLITLIVMLLLAGGNFTVASASKEASLGSNRLRESDIDRILANNRIVNSYIKCLLDKDPCSPDGAELKRALPDALATGCSRCSANEKLLSRKVIAHLMRKRKGDWDKLVAKYDPRGEFRKRYGSDGGLAGGKQPTTNNKPSKPKPKPK